MADLTSRFAKIYRGGTMDVVNKVHESSGRVPHLPSDWELGSIVIHKVFAPVTARTY